MFKLWFNFTALSIGGMVSFMLMANEDGSTLWIGTACMIGCYIVAYKLGKQHKLPIDLED